LFSRATVDIESWMVASGYAFAGARQPVTASHNSTPLAVEAQE